MPNLTEQQVRDIIQEELANFVAVDRYIFQKDLQLFNGRNIQLGRGIGTKIATATDQLIGFWGTTPVNQPATVANPAGQTNDLDSEARTAIEAIIARLKEPGVIASS